MEVLGAVSSCLTLAEVSLKTVAFLHQLSETQNDFAQLKAQIVVIDQILKGFQRTHAFFPNGLGISNPSEPSLFILAAVELQTIQDELQGIKVACQKVPDNDSSRAKKRRWVQQQHKLPGLYGRARDAQSILQLAMNMEVMSMMKSQSRDLKRYHSDVEFVMQMQTQTTYSHSLASGVHELRPEEPMKITYNSITDFDEEDALRETDDCYDTSDRFGSFASNTNAIEARRFIQHNSTTLIARSKQINKCRCRCHLSENSHQVPSRFQQLLQFMTYTRFCTSNRVQCSNPRCKCERDSWIKVQFQPPEWLWSQSFLFKATYGISGLSVALRPARLLSSVDLVWGRIENSYISDCDLREISSYFPDDVDMIQTGLIEYAIQYCAFEAIEVFLGVWANILPKKGLPMHVGFKATEYLENHYYENEREMGILIKVISFTDEMPEHKSTLVHEAARRGNGMDKALREEGWAMDELDHAGHAPLHIACENGHLEAVQQLMNAKANVNIPDYMGWTPLMRAARNNQLDCMRALIRAHCDIEQQAMDGARALHRAAKEAWPEAATALRLAGASVSARGWVGRTALHYLAESKPWTDPDRVRDTANLLAVAKDVNINARDDSGLTPVLYALSESNLPAIRSLVEIGADLHILDRDSSNILHYAAAYANTEILRFLNSLQLKGIDTNHLSKYGYTPKDELNYCVTAYTWNLGGKRRPSIAEREAFAELCEDIRDRNLHQDIEITERAVELLRKPDGEGARAQISLLINQQKEWQQEQVVSWYRGIDKMIQGQNYDLVIEMLTEHVEDMLATINTSFWGVEELSSDSSQVEEGDSSESEGSYSEDEVLRADVIESEDDQSEDLDRDDSEYTC